MAGDGSSNQTAMTPFRKSRTRLDASWPVLIEPAWTACRSGADIRAAMQGGIHDSYNVFFSGVGCWAMQEIQVNAWTTAERDDRPGSQLRLQDYNAVPAVKERPRFRKSTELGVVYPSLVMTSGDHYLRREVPADGSFNDSFDGHVAAYGRPSYLFGTDAGMKRTLISKRLTQVDGGLVARFQIGGTQLHAPDVPYAIYFGGMVIPGHGTFCLAFHGDGNCRLLERRDAADWVLVSEWRWCPAANVCNRSHQMIILPARRPTGELFLSFRASEPGDRTGQLASLTNTYVTRAQSPLEHVVPLGKRWLVDGRPVTRASVTGVGPVVHDERADQLVHHQTSFSRYPAFGSLLVDYPIGLDFFVGKGQNFRLTCESTTPGGATLTGRVYDSETFTELTLVSRGPDYAVYQPNHGMRALHVEYEFGTDAYGTVTPLLWSYKISRDGLYDITSTTEVIVKGRHYSISGPEADPTHETARVEIKDLTNSASILATRGFIHTIVDTQYDPDDATKKSVLFEGVTTRVEALKKGTAGRTFPDPNWRDFDTSFAGIWAKLNQTINFAQLKYDQDPNPASWGANNEKPPWKVTDLCRVLLQSAGFPLSMLDVPDSPIRFFPTPGSDERLILEPMIRIGDFVVNTLKNYLGWFLIWDGNATGAGAPLRGMLRARRPSTSPYTNLARFQTAGASGKLVHRPESYGTTNYTGTNPLAFIRKGTFRTWVKPPEANMVIVMSLAGDLPGNDGKARLSNWAANAKSYNWGRNADGSVYESADPSDPDYLGYMVPLIIMDPSLGSQEAVDWHVRRYYDFTCHAIKMCSFEAPLLLVNDASDSYQVAPRPLRYYDPVLINGAQFLVRNCNPDYTKDDHQWAHFECEAPRF